MERCIDGESERARLRKGLRVTPRGKQWLTVYRAQQVFGKVLSPSDFVILGGPAGGEAPGKVLRLQERIVYDS